MTISLSLSETLKAYLRGYRHRARMLPTTHVKPEVLEEAMAMARLLDETPVITHSQVLILVLYWGTSLTADDIRGLGRHGVEMPNEGELALELPGPESLSRQIWLDQEAARLMHGYIRRLEGKQDRLFQDDLGESYTRNEIHQLVTSFTDRHDEHFEHFFPIYHEHDYQVLPTPLRLNANIHYTGRGVTIAFIDSGFYPHPDLVKPRNRVQKYLNIAEPRVDDFEEAANDSWHGMQTSVSAAGNGYLSNGLYKANAPDADVVLLKVRGPHGIQTRYIIEAIEWCVRHRKDYGIRVINISLGGERPGSFLRSALDQAAEAAVQAGIVVVAAAGNAGWDDGSEVILPPASAPSVITVGGLNDHNRLDVDAYQMYWSSYGPTMDGIHKPEIVAPGIWVAAPILPGSLLYLKAGWIHRLQNAPDEELQTLVKEARAAGVPWGEWLEAESSAAIREELERRIKEHKLVVPYYQHVDGTSFSAPIVCSVVAQMLEANPALTPARVKALLLQTTDKIYNVPLRRQGHGLIHPRKAVKEAANDLYRTGIKRPNSPYVLGGLVTFYFRSLRARTVAVGGDFNGWSREAHPMKMIAPGLWSIRISLEAPSSHAYKYVVDEGEWFVDPENLNREPDRYGGENARVNILT